MSCASRCLDAHLPPGGNDRGRLGLIRAFPRVVKSVQGADSTLQVALTYQERIVRDSAICGGQPVIRGTRVLVRTVLSYLAHGAESAEILAEFPSLSEPDIRAVIAFASAAVSEALPAPTPIPPEIKIA